jgi:hypothetical protein
MVQVVLLIAKEKSKEIQRLPDGCKLSTGVFDDNLEG